MFTICHFETGHTFNVFPDTSFMQGTIRSFDEETLELVKKRIVELSENIAYSMGCRVQVSLDGEYPTVVNSPQETQHVIRLA